MSRPIYILTSFTPREADHPSSEDAHEYEISSDGSVAVYEERVGAFSSVEKAEETMKKLIAVKDAENRRWGSWIKYACFTVEELRLDDPLYGDGYPSQYESRRSYLGDGTLCYASDTDDRCEKAFIGGDGVDRFVKKGGYAFWLGDGSLMPVYIEETSFSKEEWARRFKPGVKGDSTDDSGLAFRPDGNHCHPIWVMTFPVSILENYKVPDETKKNVEAGMKEYYGA